MLEPLTAKLKLGAGRPERQNDNPHRPSQADGLVRSVPLARFVQRSRAVRLPLEAELLVSRGLSRQADYCEANYDGTITRYHGREEESRSYLPLLAHLL